MSNLEHLIENGLCNIEDDYHTWRSKMQEDCNWEGNENITIDQLWEICQYVCYVYLPTELCSLKEEE